MVQSVLGGCKLNPKFAIQSNTPLLGDVSRRFLCARPGFDQFQFHRIVLKTQVSIVSEVPFCLIRLGSCFVVESEFCFQGCTAAGAQ